MRKIVISLLLITLLITFTACNNNNTSLAETSKSVSASEDTTSNVVVPEKVFIGMVNEIYMNYTEYVGKTIEIAGIFGEQVDSDGKKIYGVFRYGPGCCNNDATAGFSLQYDGAYPKNNDWIKVTGTLCADKEGNYVNIYIKAEKIEVKEQRGVESVYN